MDRIVELENNFKNIFAIWSKGSVKFYNIDKKSKTNKSIRVLSVYEKQGVFNLEKIKQKLIDKGGILKTNKRW